MDGASIAKGIIQPLIPRIPIFVSIFDALPIQVAEGLAIVESDVAETIELQIFGRSLILSLVRLSRANDGDFEVIFADPTAHHLLQIPDILRFSIQDLRIGIQRSDSSFAVDVRGRTMLDLHLPAVLGGRSIQLAGSLQVMTQSGLALQSLRMDLDDAEWSIPLPFGPCLNIRARSMHVVLSSDRSPILQMEVACSMQGLPRRVQDTFGHDSFQANIRWSKEGFSISATTVFESLNVVLPSFSAFAGSAPWDLGELTLSAKYLRMSIGRTIECSVDIGLDTPAILHDILQPHIDFRLTTVNDEVRIAPLSSPFRFLECQRVPNGNLRGRAEVGGGKVFFDMPSLHIDWGRRCIVADGYLAHRGVKIPLESLRLLLEGAGLQVFAKHLPKSIALQSLRFNEIVNVFSELIGTAGREGAWATWVQQALESAFKALHHLPQHFSNDFLHAQVPNEITFRLECSFDFDVRIHFTPSRDPARSDASPLRLLIPMLGLHGPELIGLTLYRWGIGEMHGGQVFTFELDAEVDIIDISSQWLTSGRTSQSRVVLRDLVVLGGVSAGVPWIWPLSFRKLGWHQTSVNGMSGAFQCELSLPKVDFRTLIHDLVAARNVTGAQTKASVAFKDIECRVGPAYLQLPRCLGSKSIGSMDQVVSLRAPHELEHLLIAWQTMNVDRLFETILSTIGERNMEIDISAESGEAPRSLTAVVDAFLDVIGRLPVEMRRGIGGRRFQVQLEQLTPTGLRFRVEVPDVIAGGSRPIYFDWSWQDLQGL